jgi:PAS domain S-box-containing protein
VVKAILVPIIHLSNHIYRTPLRIGENATSFHHQTLQGHLPSSRRLNVHDGPPVAVVAAIRWVRDVTYSECVVVCTLAAEESRPIEGVLGEAGIACRRVDPNELRAMLESGAGAAIVAENVLRSTDLSSVAAWVENQPSWSDFPFVVLTEGDGDLKRDTILMRFFGVLGNVSFVETPFRNATLASLIKSTLRGRRRQYEARAHLIARKKYEAESQRMLTELAAEREKTKEALLGEKAFSGLLLTAVPAGIVAYDRDQKITTWNPVMEKFFGACAEHAIGHPIQDFFDASEPNETVADVEVVNRTTGQKVLCETQHAPLTGGDGQIIGAVAFFRDITERRHVEEQLRQSQKMETIGQLTGGVAHDFNNLLAAVVGNLELLRRKLPADTPLLRYIDGALQGASRGASLTQRLLAFARRQDLKTESVDLTRLLEGMRGLLVRSIGPANSLDMQAPYGLPAATIDHNQLELAVLNLAHNARDAMPDGGAVIIRLDQGENVERPLLAEGDYLRVTVADTGVGMDPQTLKSAIEPFFTTKQLGKGTGLGLSMVHGLAVQLGGMLRLSSTLGQGSLAELWLPVAGAPAEEALSNTTTGDASRDETPSSRILVVDDDTLIAMSTVSMIEDLGHCVIEANSGTQALDILRSGVHVDALVTDYAMPGMTGIELAGYARELFPMLPILLATGYAELPAGTTMDLPRLKKPYRQQELSEHLARLLKAPPADPSN